MSINDPIPDLKEDLFFIRARTKSEKEWLYLVAANPKVIKWTPNYYNAKFFRPTAVDNMYQKLRKRSDCKNMVLQLGCITLVEMEIIDEKTT